MSDEKKIILPFSEYEELKQSATVAQGKIDEKQKEIDEKQKEIERLQGFIDSRNVVSVSCSIPRLRLLLSGFSGAYAIPTIEYKSSDDALKNLSENKDREAKDVMLAFVSRAEKDIKEKSFSERWHYLWTKELKVTGL